MNFTVCRWFEISENAFGEMIKIELFVLNIFLTEMFQAKA